MKSYVSRVKHPQSDITHFEDALLDLRFLAVLVEHVAGCEKCIKHLEPLSR